MRVERQGDAQRDQHGPQHKCKAQPQEKPNSAVASPGYLFDWEKAEWFPKPKQCEKKIPVRREPKPELVARLPEKVQARANHERANNSHQLGHISCLARQNV